METLAARYDAFYEALRRKDDDVARRHFLALAGVREARARAVSGALAAPLIRYEVPRAIDLVALRAGARHVAKFEDLPLKTARGLREKLQREGFQTLTVGPYTRRMDVTLSVDEAPTQSALTERYTVIASRGNEARDVANAERGRTPDGTLRAGLALGYPRCCVERFVTVEQSPEAARDGVNEASLRAFLDTGTPPWELNPLSDLSPIGFMPCRANCPGALVFARGVLAALERDAYDRTRAVLSRPVVFIRYTMFWALDGATVHERAVGYTRAVAQDEPSLGELARWRDVYFGEALAVGDTVAIEDGVMRVVRVGEPVAAWELTEPVAPRVVSWAGSGPETPIVRKTISKLT